MEANTTKTLPNFKFTGEIQSINCNFMEPLDGYIITHASEFAIKSIEVQLVRVESFEGKT